MKRESLRTSDLSARFDSSTNFVPVPRVSIFGNQTLNNGFKTTYNKIISPSSVEVVQKSNENLRKFTSRSSADNTSKNPNKKLLNISTYSFKRKVAKPKKLANESIMNSSNGLKNLSTEEYTKSINNNTFKTYKSPKDFPRLK